MPPPLPRAGLQPRPLPPPGLFRQLSPTLGNGSDFRFDKNNNKLGPPPPNPAFPPPPHACQHPPPQKPCLSARQGEGAVTMETAGLWLAPGGALPCGVCPGWAIVHPLAHSSGWNLRGVTGTPGLRASPVPCFCPHLKTPVGCRVGDACSLPARPPTGWGPLHNLSLQIRS